MFADVKDVLANLQLNEEDFYDDDIQFLKNIFDYIMSQMGVQYGMLGRLCDEDRVKAVFMYHKPTGKVLDNFEYLLDDTPCDNVVRRGRSVCCYPQDVVAMFPQDEMLADVGAQSYLGTPIFDGSTRRCLGLFVLLGTEKMDDETVPFLISIITMFQPLLSTRLLKMMESGDA